MYSCPLRKFIIEVSGRSGQRLAGLLYTEVGRLVGGSVESDGDAGSEAKCAQPLKFGARTMRKPLAGKLEGQSSGVTQDTRLPAGSVGRST